MSTTVDTETVSALDPERADLLTELALARAALIGAVEGLTGAQLAEHPTASALCLGGLVKHVASTEQDWMRFVSGEPGAMEVTLPEGVTWQDLYAGTAREVPQFVTDRQRDFSMLADDTLDGVLARYGRVAARTEEIVATLPDLSTVLALPEAPWNEPGAVRSVRRILVHLVAETVQHVGHADILRESIDGRTAG
jgi:uncharacterized damage-inducible protein DinB